MPKTNLDRAEKVYQYIRWHISEKGYPPSYREIAAACDIPSTSNARQVVKALERQGRLSTVEGKMRTIRVIGE